MGVTLLSSCLCSQERCITFDRVLGSDAAQVGVSDRVMGGGWEHSGPLILVLSDFPDSLLRGGLGPGHLSWGCACVSGRRAEQELPCESGPHWAPWAEEYSVALLLGGREAEAPRPRASGESQRRHQA